MVLDGGDGTRQGQRIARTQAVNPGLELARQGVQCKAGDKREEAGGRTQGRGRRGEDAGLGRGLRAVSSSRSW
jgi:hypothetical protein